MPNNIIRSSRRLKKPHRRCDRCGKPGGAPLAQSIGPFKAGTTVCGKCLKLHQPVKKAAAK